VEVCTLYLTIFTEIIGGFFILFIVVKLLGKTQISQITPFDFISALVLGELVGNAIYDQETGFGIILFASSIWGLLIFITEFLTQKSIKLRLVLEGKPSMIICQGKLDWKEMKRNRLDIDQLQQLLRAKDIFSMKDVEYAILENNGSVSVLRKAEADQPTCSDMQIKGEKRMLPYTIISDGEIMNKKLHEAGVDDEWLQQELDKMGIAKPDDISYAEYVPGKDLFVQRY
jgi:uncharacterized membrane protein YcaP (DUF421 family)